MLLLLSGISQSPCSWSHILSTRRMTLTPKVLGGRNSDDQNSRHMRVFALNPDDFKSVFHCLSQAEPLQVSPYTAPCESIEEATALGRSQG